jgi:hypothetical protein
MHKVKSHDMLRSRKLSEVDKLPALSIVLRRRHSTILKEDV